MSIRVTCNCGKTYIVKEELAGRKGTCKACGTVFTIPHTQAAVRTISKHKLPVNKMVSDDGRPVSGSAKTPSKGSDADKPSSVNTKACPFCGEQILIAAKKCKHCGEFLVEQQHSGNTTEPQQNGFSSSPESVFAAPTQYVITKRFRLRTQITPDDVKNVILSSIANEHRFTEISSSERYFEIAGAKKEKVWAFLGILLWPFCFFMAMVKFRAVTHYWMEKDVLFISVQGQSRPIWAWYAFILISLPLMYIGIGFIIFLLFGIAFLVQRNQARKAFTKALDMLEGNYGTI